MGEGGKRLTVDAAAAYDCATMLDSITRTL